MSDNTSECKHSKYKLCFKLKQHTPIIHFQADQKGATLRASELKPKLDRFLIDKLKMLENGKPDWSFYGAIRARMAMSSNSENDISIIKQRYQHFNTNPSFLAGTVLVSFSVGTVCATECKKLYHFIIIIIISPLEVPCLSLAGAATSIIFAMTNTHLVICHDKCVCHNKTHLLS